LHLESLMLVTGDGELALRDELAPDLRAVLASLGGG
jgi:hypothetical protein